MVIWVKNEIDSIGPMTYLWLTVGLQRPIACTLSGSVVVDQASDSGSGVGSWGGGYRSGGSGGDGSGGSRYILNVLEPVGSRWASAGEYRLQWYDGNKNFGCRYLSTDIGTNIIYDYLIGRTDVLKCKLLYYSITYNYDYPHHT